MFKTCVYTVCFEVDKATRRQCQSECDTFVLAMFERFVWDGQVIWI